jgi:hypothetical protein
VMTLITDMAGHFLHSGVNRLRGGGRRSHHGEWRRGEQDRDVFRWLCWRGERHPVPCRCARVHFRSMPLSRFHSIECVRRRSHNVLRAQKEAMPLANPAFDNSGTLRHAIICERRWQSPIEESLRRLAEAC